MKSSAQSWQTFSTPMGVGGLSWNADGLTSLHLPDRPGSEIAQALAQVTGCRRPARTPPPWIKALIKKIQAHLGGAAQDFSRVPWRGADHSEFALAVYRATQQIPSGSVVSYGDIAARIGRPGAVRAVGTALGRNPVPLIVPCHRVIAAANKLGGFSSAGGRETKIALLAKEGVRLERPHALSTAARWQAAVAALRSQDPVFGKFMQALPPFTFRPHLSAEPLTALTGTIVNQQLSNKAAAVILKRVNALVMDAGRVCPHSILNVAPVALRAAGLSHMKITYLQDLARTYLDGRLSPLAQLKRMRDEQIIDEFTQVKGIGRWTVEMYLIFNLGRADVFPVLDLGVRKSIARLYSLRSIPAPKALDRYGARWTPYRTVASLYLWRALDGVTTFP